MTPRRSDSSKLARRRIHTIAPTMILFVSVSMAGWQVSAADRSQGSSNQAARRDALRAIPLAHLQPADRGRVVSVLKSTSVYRRLPTRTIDCDPQMFLFLVRNPEIVVSLWDELGISNVVLRRTADSVFEATDGQGTRGLIEVLRDRMDEQLIYARGSYESPLVRRPIDASSVLLLRMAYLRGASGRYYVRARMDAFVKFEQAGPDLLAKTFQPLLGKVADYNFVETMKFVSRLSRTAERHPEKTRRLYEKLDGLDPELRRQLVQISNRLAYRAAVRPTSAVQFARRVPGGDRTD